MRAARPYEGMWGSQRGVQGAANAQEEPDSWLRGLWAGERGGSQRGERTLNMSSMLRTFDVSKLSD